MFLNLELKKTEKYVNYIYKTTLTKSVLNTFQQPDRDRPKNGRRQSNKQRTLYRRE